MKDFIILCVIFIFLYFACSGPDSSSDTPRAPSNNKFTAYRYASDFVKQRLKSPSTAKFPGTIEKDSHITEYAGTYIINSWVDSQNSFGAMIRSNFSCKITFVGDQVKCDDLLIY